MSQIIKHIIDPRQKQPCEFFSEYLGWQYSEKTLKSRISVRRVGNNVELFTVHQSRPKVLAAYQK